ncbi:MAG: hypothetical protein JJW01_03365, partial [Alphaproteobacteria bacterium]|nr:hypothetical protein [Rickettsiales bacterium]
IQREQSDLNITNKELRTDNKELETNNKELGDTMIQIQREQSDLSITNKELEANNKSGAVSEIESPQPQPTGEKGRQDDKMRGMTSKDKKGIGDEAKQMELERTNIELRKSEMRQKEKEKGQQPQPTGEKGRQNNKMRGMTSKDKEAALRAGLRASSAIVGVKEVRSIGSGRVTSTGADKAKQAGMAMG